MYKVLIVDDELLVRKALWTIVSGTEGFEVAACVESGEQAVVFCREHDIHLVFMDIALPGMTGIEAAGKINKINPSVQICIISVLSGFDIIKKALSSKIRVYLVKPVSFSEIRKILDDFCQDKESDHSYSEQLAGLIYQRQYRETMKSIPDIVHEVILEKNGNAEKVLVSFLQIVNQILADSRIYIGERTELSEKAITEQFPVNKIFAGEEISWVFWLSDVVDAICWQPVIANHDYLGQVKEYIDREISTDISLSSVCDACSISQSYLSKLFRRYFGISVMDYIHLYKIRKAKMYIAFTDYSMTQIGHRTGYNDSSYFSKIFKKYEGMTPKQYKSAYNVQGSKEKKKN